MKKDLKELSDAELLKDYKNSKNLLFLYLGLVLVMLVAGVITTIKQGVNAFTFLPFAFMGVLVIYRNSYDKAGKEMKSRNLK
ncbi:MAG: hypothetical protein J5I50_03785 [Chitinophagaceae bacterium]|nr:hypothetical protein [Chitinophagaceae bacterium]